MTRLPSPRSRSSARASQVGVAAAFLAVALVFVAFLVIGLIVAAIMGLATIMPAWLAALLVCAVFLLIAADRGPGRASASSRRPCRWFPRTPSAASSTISASPRKAPPSILPCWTRTPTQYKAAKAAKEEAAAKAKAEKEAKKAAEPDFGPPPTEAELRRRLDQRRTHLTGVRDELNEELDVKTQAQALLAAAQVKLQDGKEQLSGKVAGFRSAAARTAKRPATSAGAAGTAQAWPAS